MSLAGFEDITHELNEYELTELVPVFVKALAKKVGPDAAVTNKQMVTGMQAKGFKVTDTRVRKIINYIRRNDLLVGLVASSKGYYITTDPEEIMRYIHSLAGRESEIRTIKVGMLEYLKTLLEESDNQTIKKAS